MTHSMTDEELLSSIRLLNEKAKTARNPHPIFELMFDIDAVLEAADNAPTRAELEQRLRAILKSGNPGR